jgi:hypothetical protein
MRHFLKPSGQFFWDLIVLAAAHNLDSGKNF